MKSLQTPKNFIYKLLEKNDNIPLMKNELIKNKINNGNTNSYNLFYQALFKNETNLGYKVKSLIKESE